MLRRSVGILTICVLSVAARAGDPLAEANALLGAGDSSAAAAAFGAIVLDEPGNGAAWFGLGQSLLSLGRYNDAATAFGKSLAAGQAPRPALLGAARASAAAGSTAAAFAWLEKLAALGPPGHSSVQAALELKRLAGDPRFAKIVEALSPCASGKYRQFDFWLGQWDVASAAAAAAGRPPSHNSLTSIDDGCAMLEQFTTPNGYSGTSISYYDPRADRWVQAWMDNQGQPILHRGGLNEDGAMVLLDEPAEGRPLNRTTWTPLEDGPVRQHWESSTDGGKSWSTVFDGIYTRRE